MLPTEFLRGYLVKWMIYSRVCDILCNLYQVGTAYRIVLVLMITWAYILFIIVQKILIPEVENQLY